MNIAANDNRDPQSFLDYVAVTEFMRLTKIGLPYELAKIKAVRTARRETAKEFGREL